MLYIKIGGLLEPMKHAVKRRRNAGSPVTRLAVSSLSLLWRVVSAASRMFSDSEYRSVLYLKMFNSKNVHQTTPFTRMDRYPAIFSECRDNLEIKQELNILSYGCSTGEEVLTLRRYFPSARIVGAEINQRSLSICRKLSVDNKILFIYSTAAEIQKHGPFDAIFCMAVLQRNPCKIRDEGTLSLKKIYPFEKFERQLVELDKLLKIEGLLVIHFTQYSFLDTSVSSKYEILDSCSGTDRVLPIFDADSNLVDNPAPQHRIFRKLRS